jgi:hypothetical protein
MNDPIYDEMHNHFFSYQALEGLSSCHRPVLEPHLLWYANADNPQLRRQYLVELKVVRKEVARELFEELPNLLPPESNVQPVFEFIRESKESPIASGFDGPESVLAAQTGYAVGQLDSNRIGEVPPVGLVMLTERLRELVPLLRPQFPAGTRLHMYAAYLMVRMGL